MQRNAAHDSLIAQLEWDFKHKGKEVDSEYMENVKKRLRAGDHVNQIRWDHRQLLAKWAVTDMPEHTDEIWRLCSQAGEP